MLIQACIHDGIRRNTVSIRRIDPYYVRHARCSYTKGYIALITYQLRSGIQMDSDRRGEQGADEASSPLGGGLDLENRMAGASLGSQVGSWSSGDPGSHRLFGMQLVCGRHLSPLDHSSLEHGSKTGRMEDERLQTTTSYGGGIRNNRNSLKG